MGWGQAEMSNTAKYGKQLIYAEIPPGLPGTCLVLFTKQHRFSHLLL